MKFIKSIWTTITGSISSIIPLFFAVCKSGACTVACASPVASLLGISSASLMASPLMQSMFPVLIAISAVSFTVSYYNIYVLPKYAATNCETDCACEPAKNSFQEKFTLWSFWIGLIASIIFFSYFEFQNYKSNSAPKKNIIIEKKLISNDSTSIISDTSESEEPCCSGGKKCEK